METVKPFTETLTIKSVLFQTGTTGVVFPVLRFFPNKRLKKMGINAAIFTEVSDLYKINDGARVKFNFNEQMVPEIKTVIRPATKPIAIPEKCTHCETTLVTSGRLHCPNLYCTATSRGFLYRLIKYSYMTVSLDLITTFLSEYAYMDSKVSIDHPADFRAIFQHLKEKNTQARENHWRKQHPRNWELLFKLELKIDEFLKREELDSNIFWSICNFPNLQEDELYALSKMCPKKYLNGDEKGHFNSLNKRVKTLLVNNHDFVVFLNDLFNSFGDKNWKTLKTY